LRHPVAAASGPIRQAKIAFQKEAYLPRSRRAHNGTDLLWV
jgi:hypothetical protein